MQLRTAVRRTVGTPAQVTPVEGEAAFACLLGLGTGGPPERGRLSLGLARLAAACLPTASVVGLTVSWVSRQ